MNLLINQIIFCGQETIGTEKKRVNLPHMYILQSMVGPHQNKLNPTAALVPAP